MTAATTIPQDVAPGLVARRVFVCLGVAVGVLGCVQLLSTGADQVSASSLLAAVAAGTAVALLPWLLLPGILLLAGAVAVLVADITVPVFATFLAMMVCSFTLARYGSLKVCAAGYAVLVGTVAVVAAPEVREASEGWFGLVYPVFYFGGSGVLGWLLRQRARHTHALTAYAVSLEREAQQQAELAAAAERERLAREMHDVVSHGVSIMVLQAEAAREVLARRPADAATALDAIAGAGRAAMDDLHRMLDVLRAPDTDLERLVDSVRTTGLAVALDVEGDWTAVPEPVRVVLFRVAQESLTNTLRHGGGARTARVVVHCQASPATLEVLDDGPGGGGSGAGLGSGLEGLSARVARLGGELAAGPRDDGPGFRVLASADLPEHGARP